MDNKSISTLIKEKRHEKQITQKQLAELLHVSTAAVSKWENGLNFPDPQNMKPLAEALDIPLHDLLMFNLPETTLKPDFGTEDCNAAAAPQPPAPAPSPTDRPTGKSFQIKIAFLFLCIVLLGGVTTVCWLNLSEKTPSFTVVNEYYDDYEGQRAYYIFVECTGEPTEDDYNESDHSFHKDYTEYYNNTALIIVIYYKKGDYDINVSDPFASAIAYTFLFQRPSL